MASKSRHTSSGSARAESPRAWRRLTRAELPPRTHALARYLLGKLVVHDSVHGRLAGRIVETEAYPPRDPACHAYVGETARNRSLFAAHGTCYVYFIYGTWFMLNVAAEDVGVGAGVLIRALEPVCGLESMRRLRGTERARDLTRGPGRVAQAFAIEARHDGLDLCAPGALWLAHADAARGVIARSVRIGITQAAEKPWRYFERGNVYVSGPRRLNA